MLGWVDVCPYRVTTFVGELHLHESQPHEELDVWGWLGKLSLDVSLFLDADIVLCGASNCVPANLCSLTRYVS